MHPSRFRPPANFRRLTANRSALSGLPIKFSVRPGMAVADDAGQNSMRTRKCPQSRDLNATWKGVSAKFVIWGNDRIAEDCADYTGLCPTRIIRSLLRFLFGFTSAES